MTDEWTQAERGRLRRELRRATWRAALVTALGVSAVMIAGYALLRSGALPAGVSMTSLLLLLTVAVPLGLFAMGVLREALWRRTLGGELERLRERRALDACARSLPAAALERLAGPERSRVEALRERERRGPPLAARDYARGLRLLLAVAPAASAPDEGGPGGASTRSETASPRPAARDAAPAADTAARRSPRPPR